MGAEAKNDWIEWNGGKRPVPADMLVDVKLRNGREHLHDPLLRRGRADEWQWHWEEYDPRYDLVAYRVPPS